MIHLLVLLRSDEICRVSVTAQLQRQLTQHFEGLMNTYLGSLRRIVFDGDYSTDDDEVFEIPDFALSEPLSRAAVNPLSVRAVDLPADAEEIFAICAVSDDGPPHRLGFQTFDARRLLTNKFAIVLGRDTYARLEQPGLLISDRLDVFFDGSSLFFTSYHNARRVVDLWEYYHEATDDDIGQFVAHPSLSLDDIQWLLDNADATIRKKVTLLERNGRLASLNVDDVRTSAKTLNVELQFKRIDGRDTIYLPRDKAAIKTTLKFLDEDYFEAPLSHRTCVTNSKKYV